MMEMYAKLISLIKVASPVANELNEINIIYV